MKQDFMIGGRIPVFLKEPNYDAKLKKRSHKARKHTYNNDHSEKLPCLEWGNASIVFQFVWDQDLYYKMVCIWEEEYNSKGEDFNVELYEHIDNVIEWRIMCGKPFYETNRKGFESVLGDIDGNVLSAWESLPESLRECVELCYISDFDYLEYGEEVL